jgi:hypothetical protein
MSSWTRAHHGTLMLALDSLGRVEVLGQAGQVVGGGGAGRAKRMAFAEGVVFVVGGAGYVEYGNLEEWAGRTGKRVTYGGTEIVDPGGFVNILEGLGKGTAP